MKLLQRFHDVHFQSWCELLLRGVVDLLPGEGGESSEEQDERSREERCGAECFLSFRERGSGLTEIGEVVLPVGHNLEDVFRDLQAGTHSQDYVEGKHRDFADSPQAPDCNGVMKENGEENAKCDEEDINETLADGFKEDRVPAKSVQGSIFDDVESHVSRYEHSEDPEIEDNTCGDSRNGEPESKPRERVVPVCETDDGQCHG